ncbi:MAG: zinc ribbon domain-containing protein [Chloroflexi bacterium]|nr:zinc ribbon domain-containing protein [Chloroflexota bacterium]
MELIGSLFLILALALLVALFVARPFLFRGAQTGKEDVQHAREQDHLRSSLLAERDRVLTALQELDFDYSMGKIPEEDYPEQRAELMTRGAAVLRRLDELQPESAQHDPVEARIEAAVAARRADAAVNAAAGTTAATAEDELEELIASRKRARQEKAAGFCPGCGRPVQKSDKFCARCGRAL